MMYARALGRCRATPWQKFSAKMFESKQALAKITNAAKSRNRCKNGGEGASAWQLLHASGDVLYMKQSRLGAAARAKNGERRLLAAKALTGNDPWRNVTRMWRRE